VKGMALAGPRQLEAVELEEPQGDGAVLVRIDQVGICGTDLKIHAGQIPVTYPRILGHELVGRVIRAGDSIPIGTRVLVDPSIACWTCPPCRRGRPNLCVNGALMGRDVDGGLAEIVAVDEHRLHRVPEAISSAEAALLQVLGTCVHAQAQLPETAPGVAVVVGLGVAGLLHLQLLRQAGRKVVGVARSAEKRAMALELGATAACAPDEAEALVGELTDGDGAALVVEAVGKVGTLAQAIRLAFPGATILVFGTITESVLSEPFPWYDLYYKELSIVNPRAALGEDYDRAIALATDGSVDLGPLWSESFPLAKAAAAFDALGPGSTRLKVTIDL